jgi:hypothetical protein
MSPYCKVWRFDEKNSTPRRSLNGSVFCIPQAAIPGGPLLPPLNVGSIFFFDFFYISSLFLLMRLNPALPRSGPSWRPSSALTQHTSSCTTAASQTPQAALSRCPRLRARRRGLRRSRPRGRPWQLRGCRSHRCRRLQSRRPRLVQRHLGSHLRL